MCPGDWSTPETDTAIAALPNVCTDYDLDNSMLVLSIPSRKRENEEKGEISLVIPWPESISTPHFSQSKASYRPPISNLDTSEKMRRIVHDRTYTHDGTFLALARNNVCHSLHKRLTMHELAKDDESIGMHRPSVRLGNISKTMVLLNTTNVMPGFELSYSPIAL